MTISVRGATGEDEEAVRLLRNHAFLADLASPASPGAIHPPDERRLVAVADGRVVGHVGVWELGHWLGGRRVPAGGVQAVVIDPAWRGRGVGTRLLREALAAMAARGEALATLFPLTRAVYRRLGWEIGGERPGWRIDTAALAALPRADDVELVPGSPGDVPAMAALEARLARDVHGMLARPEPFARRSLDAGDDHAVYLARRGGELVGYAVYAHGESPDEQELFTLRVRELVAADAAAGRALWRLLGGHASGTRSVTGVGPTVHPLELLLPERALQPVPAGTWRWMTRVVDLPAAVTARGWPPGVTTALELEVEDHELPANRGRWRLTVEDGTATLEPGGAGHVQLDVGAVASLLTGWATPATLVAAGRVSGGRDRDLAALSAALAGPTPWVRDFF